MKIDYIMKAAVFQKKLFLLILLLFSGLMMLAQNPEAEVIKKRMTQIRQTTNWKDKDAAAKANQEISTLSKKLMMMKAPQGQPGLPPASGNTPPETTQQNVESKMALWDAIWSAAKKGKNARLDLAKHLRDSIVAAYKEDDSPAVKCPDWFSKMDVLYLDMSMPGVEQVVNQMERYQSIETLIITGGEFGVPVDLDDLIGRASNYPLKSLYIINFRSFVNNIPSTISNFINLNEVGLFNNSLDELPVSISSLSNLKLLYIDKNPISSIMPAVRTFTNLETLGVGKTSIPEEEIQAISNVLPDCEILR